MNYHTPALLNETIEGLDIKPDGIYIDVTFGGGGHSSEILKRLDNGKLIAFDQDIDAHKNTIKDERFTLIQANFKYLQNFLNYHKIEKVDGILADLGVSTHHFDMPERGFSFRFDSKLDMRMNTDASFDARHLINIYTKKELFVMFKKYSEIKNAGKLVEAIITARKEKEIVTTTNLVKAIEGCVPKRIENKYLAKVFQALRIEVNNEIENLKIFLNQAVKFLKDDGRFVVISYHSLEDRLVKNLFRSGNFEGKQEKDIYGNIISPIKQLNRKVIVPTKQEIEENNRSRSAKMRIGMLNK